MRPTDKATADSRSVQSFAIIREIKIETFLARRRPDWQSKPGTEVAVASLQNSNIKIAVNSGGRRPGLELGVCVSAFAFSQRLFLN